MYDLKEKSHRSSVRFFGNRCFKSIREKIPHSAFLLDYFLSLPPLRRAGWVMIWGGVTPLLARHLVSKETWFFSLVVQRVLVSEVAFCSFRTGFILIIRVLLSIIYCDNAVFHLCAEDGSKHFCDSSLRKHIARVEISNCFGYRIIESQTPPILEILESAR